MISKYYVRYKEVVHYLIVGVLTTFVSLASYYICVLSFCDPKSLFQLQVANVISWIIAVTFAYFANRKFVFNSKKNEISHEIAAFYGSRIMTLLIDMGCMFFMVTLLGISDKIAKIVVQIVVTLGNYVLSKFVVFSSRED